MAQKQFATKEIIVQEGDPGQQAYVIVSGRVEMVRRMPQGETQAAILTPGMCFGESSLLEPGTPYLLTARALEPAVVESIDANEMDQALSKLPPVSSIFMKAVMNRFRKSFVKPDEDKGPTIKQGDLLKITVMPGSESLSKQFRDMVVSPSNLPFRIGGFPAENVALKNRHNHLNISSDGPPLTVSRMHCEIALEDDGLFLTDLGSRFCTVVNGKLIGRGRGKYNAPLGKGKNEVLLGGLNSPYKLIVACE